MSRGKLDDTLAAMFSNPKYSDYLFYAHIVGQCSIKIDHTLPAPAGVAFMIDHYDLYINPNEFDENTLVQRLAILKHESLHILEGHIDRLEDRIFKPWNYATDCAINQLYNNNDHLPDWVITPKALAESLGVDVPKNLSSEMYYDIIMSAVKENPDKFEDGGGGLDGLETLDSHETWAKSVGDKELQKDLTKKMIEKAQSETIKSIGKLPSQCSHWLNLHSRKAEVNWKKALRGVVGNKKINSRPTIKRANRRFPKREDLRGKTKDRTFDLLIIPDVSGSMSDEELLDTLGEARHICDMTKTDANMIQIDTVAYPPEKLTKNTKLIERKGHGGTLLSPALDMAKEHRLSYQAVVVLTDGGLIPSDVQAFAELNKKVIWLISSNGSVLKGMDDGKMQSFILKKKEL